MDEKKLFQIGDVAKMFQLSAGTLRHYERLGILHPEYIDSETGYRYYSIRQFEVLTNIRYLRALDMPLEQIAEFVHNRDLDLIENTLLKHKEIVEQKKSELEAIGRKIEHRLVQIRDARHSNLEQIKLLTTEACRLVWIKDSVKWKSYLSLEHSIRRLEKHQKVPLTFQGKVGVGICKENLYLGKYDRYDVVFIILDDEDTYEGEIDSIEPGLCVSMRFQGSHDKAPTHYQKMLQYIKAEKLEIIGFSRELNLIDNVLSSDPKQYVTEIRIPVRRVY